VILGLFVLSAIVGAAGKDISQGFDEIAHVSYVAQIQHDGTAAPALNRLRLVDPRTFRFTATLAQRRASVSHLGAGPVSPLRRAARLAASLKRPRQF
jgi:predicted aminopeptidase